MKIDSVAWTQTCCGWHGEYAEAATIDGGVARLKRKPDSGEILVMRFDAQNQRVDEDYVPMGAAQVAALLA